MGYRDYSTAKGHIVDSTGHGDFTTITSALAAASSGQTIFIRPGTYTENFSLVAGVDLVCYSGDGTNVNVNIVGKVTFSTAGQVTCSGIRFTTNSDFAIAVTGTVSSLLTLFNCYINASNNTAISFTSSGAAAAIRFWYCEGNLGTTGVAFYSNTATPGSLQIYYSTISNTGGSSTASTTGTGASTVINYSALSIPISTSSTGGMNIAYSNINSSSTNTTALTTAGTGTVFAEYTDFVSGTASAISVGTGTSVDLTNTCTINSSNTNAITGAGTLNFAPIVYTGSSTLNNVTSPSPYYSSSGWHLIQTLTASASSTLSFTNGISSRFNNYVFIFNDIVPSANGTNLQILYSINGGSSYVATGYATVINGEQAASTFHANITSSTTAINVTHSSLFGTTTPGSNGYLYIYNANFQASHGATCNSIVTTSNGAMAINTGWGQLGNSAAINAFQVLCATGTFTGKVSIYGIPN